MKEALFATLMFVWLLTGCARPEPAVSAAASCPPVPQCTAPQAQIRTHADLVQGFTAYRTAYEQCRLYRDTLAACVGQ